MKIENVVVISLEDYTEYQELKNKKKEIDFRKLKAGSIVKLKRTGSHCCGSENVNFNQPFTVVSIDSNWFITNYDEEVRAQFDKTSNYDLFIQGCNFIHYKPYRHRDYITEVISY